MVPKCSACGGSGQDELGMVCVECMGQDTTEQVDGESQEQKDKKWEGMNKSQGRIHAEGYESPSDKEDSSGDKKDPWDEDSQGEKISDDTGVPPDQTKKEGGEIDNEQSQIEKIEQARKQRVEARRTETSVAKPKQTKAKKKESRKVEFGGDSCPFMNARCEASRCVMWIRKRGCGWQVLIKTVIYRLRKPKSEEKKDGKKEGKEESKDEAQG